MRHAVPLLQEHKKAPPQVSLTPPGLGTFCCHSCHTDTIAQPNLQHSAELQFKHSKNSMQEQLARRPSCSLSHSVTQLLTSSSTDLKNTGVQMAIIALQADS